VAGKVRASMGKLPQASASISGKNKNKIFGAKLADFVAYCRL
jgi:hypothetical protein